MDMELTLIVAIIIVIVIKYIYYQIATMKSLNDVTWLLLSFVLFSTHLQMCTGFVMPHSSKASHLFASIETRQDDELTNHDDDNNDSLSTSFENIANSRYACTRFFRNLSPTIPNNDGTNNMNENDNNDIVASGTQGNPEVVKKAKEALIISQRAPTGFNAQPYRAVLVSDPRVKEQLSQYCLGRNADRVRDSDCTVVFVADCQCTRDFSNLQQLIISTSKKPLSKWMLRKIQILIALFSSGYPLPRILSNFLSYCIRTSITLLGIVTRHKVLLPSLATSETWATKNTMLFAMMYMLSCTSKNIVTCPMEGFQAAGIKRILHIPQGGRFKIPLIVSTGLPYKGNDESDDAGMTHGRGGKQQRFSQDVVIFENDKFHF